MVLPKMVLPLTAKTNWMRARRKTNITETTKAEAEAESKAQAKAEPNPEEEEADMAKPSKKLHMH